MKFFKIVWATVVGQILLIVILVFVFILLALIGTLSGGNEETVKPNSVLKISLPGDIVERVGEDPLEELGLSDLPGMEKKMGLLEILQAINTAAQDESIRGIYIDAGNISGSLTMIDEIRSAISEFKKSGKFVVAYGQTVNEAGFYMATVADEFYLNPLGMVEFNGLSADIMFFKKAMEKIGIKPIVFRVGSFKSAVEPFTREDMSPENDLQYRSFLNSLYDYMLQNIAVSRNLPFSDVKRISTNMEITSPQDAIRLGFATGEAYYGDVLDTLKSKIGVKRTKELKFITLSKYIQKINPEEKSSKNKIAVIICEGEILDAPISTGNAIVGEVTAKEIRKARLDDDIKAIVLRVNSPGGSIFASDVIWKEVQKAKAVKPIVASMSSLAASGGYYISMGCDKIIAHPMTLTGSIGIFGLWFDPTELLNNKLGITFDTVNTGKYSDFMNITRPIKKFEQEFMQKWIEEGYRNFIAKAAQGRQMDTSKIMFYAQGRVWSGQQAVEIGLVDSLGTLNDAIQIAASLAGIGDDFKVRYYPKAKTLLDNLLNKEDQAAVKEARIKAELGEWYWIYQNYRSIAQKQGIMARLPFEFKIR